MTTVSQTDFARNWQDIAANLLKVGATAYGGPAIMGIMQAELQEKRQWVSKERFVEGLSLVNMLPGASAAQLSMFLGYARGGWGGGLLGGLCFVLPGFFILLALTMGYAALGVTPIMRGALYGLGQVVDLSALILTQSRLNGHSPAPPAPSAPVLLRRPPPARDREPCPASATRRVQADGDPAPLRTTDRLFWVGLARAWTRWRQPLVIVTPDTVLRWQRCRFRAYWTRLSGRPIGVARPSPPRSRPWLHA